MPTHALGRFPAGTVRHTELPPTDPAVITGLTELVDLTATLSDVLDALGIVGVVPATVLRPAIPGARVVGRAITVRNVERRESLSVAVTSGRNSMGDTEAYHLAQPGDVVVIEGVAGVSNMGGQGFQLARREGCVGAVVDGGYRDPSAPMELDFPLWGRGHTPITGKWRAETVEVNGRVRVGGVSVAAGDIVAADDAGICFVPSDRAAEVLERAQRIDRRDALRKADIDAGTDISTLMTRKYVP